MKVDASYVVCLGTEFFTLDLNVFVLIVQTFLKNPALSALAPTQSEIPFTATQGVVLIAFLLLGWSALRRFRAV